MRLPACLFFCYFVILACSIDTTAFAQTPKIALHAKTPAALSTNTCPGSAAPEDPNTAGIPCSNYTTQWSAGSGADVYLVVGQAADTAGVAGVRFGIQYDGNLSVFGWNLCADLEIPSFSPSWPGDGSGNSIFWSTCQDSVIGGEGVHAIAGAFYVYSYAGGLFEVTPDSTNITPQLYVTSCSSAVNALTEDDLGAVGFGVPGENPCGVDPVVISDTVPGCPLPDANLNEPITWVTFNATGGVPGSSPPYTWSQTGLPPGLLFDPNRGRITGTPTLEGVFAFDVIATDSIGTADTLACSISIVVPPLVIDTVTPACPLPDGELGLNYGPVAFTATGGKPPYSWFASGLPAGLGISRDTGLIGGPLLELGTFNFSVTVYDSGFVRSDSRACTLTVVDAGQPPEFETPFATEMVDGVPWPATSHVDIDTDSRGNPHITYRVSGPAFGRRYATRQNGVWIEEPVAVNSDFDGNIELDATDRPHLSFDDFWAQRQDDGTWLLENYHPQDATRNDLAIDSQNRPHIAFFSESQLWYTVRTAPNTWVSEAVDSLGSTGIGSVSIALDAWDEPHITYSDRVPDEGFFYARKRDAVWTIEGIDAGTDYRVTSSIQIDDRGDPHVAYSGPGIDLRYAVRRDDRWHFESVDIYGAGSSLDLDASGVPHMAYLDGLSPQNKRYAVRTDTGWSIEVLDQQENVEFGQKGAISLDSQDNVHITYPRDGTGIIYKHTRVYLDSPSGGEVWPVGALRTLNWSGVGPVDVFLSSDGGSSFKWLDTVTESPAGFRVPHQPSKFCVLRIERAAPFSSAMSESLFTIEASIALLNLSAQSIDGGGVLLTWETDPGPEDLAGYTIERSPHGSEAWSVLASGVRETSYLDAFGGSGMNYRLTAVNGMGQELVLGETALTPLAALSAWPMPYRGGELTLSFATFSGLGGGSGPAEVGIYDLKGRLVRMVARGDYDAGYQTAVWDGRDETGREVSSGVYFVRAVSAGKDNQMKLVVVR